MDALEHEVVMLWAWMHREPDALEHECHRGLGLDALLEHERHDALGRYALGSVCSQE